MIRRLFFLVFLILLASCASNDSINRLYSTKIPVEKLKKDVRYAKKNLKKMQPDLYWYITEQELDAKFDSLEQNLDQPLTPNEFQLKLSPVIASIRQGHTSLGLILPIPADSVKKKYKGSTHPLSHFKYLYENERLYIKEVNGKKIQHIKKGAEVLSINGISPQQIHRKYKNTYTSDGFNQTLLPKLFARNFNQYMIAELGFVDSVQLSVFCADSTWTETVHRSFKKKKEKKKKPLLSETKTAPSKPNSNQKESKTQTTEKISKAEKRAQIKTQKEKEKALRQKRKTYGYQTQTKTYTKEVIYPVEKDSSIALLKIRNFSAGKLKAYDEIFSEFQQNKVSYLILDLRGNPGGSLNDIYRLSQYFHQEDYRFIQDFTIENRMTYMNLLKGDFGIWKYFGAPSIATLALIKSFSTYRDETGEIRLKTRYSKSKQPKELNYSGPLYVLTDGMTFSAAALISAHLKDRPNTLFVGDETGGTFNGTVAGIMPLLKLPHSKLKLRVGLLTVRPVHQIEEEGYGVKPDVYIKPTLEDLIEETDPELEWILQDIENKKSLSN